jgi:allophanate hydrolase
VRSTFFDLWASLGDANFDERCAALRRSAHEARESKHPIWISVINEDALSREIDDLTARLAAGQELPLLGVSFAVKDNIDVKGLATTAACPSFSRMPEDDAPVVARLREAGAIAIGKTNMDQFATGLVGTRSPYGALSSVFSSDHISGGSSSGSAVAVANGQVCFSLGTDTAGSGRVPAAFNALVGLKPTKGLLSTVGVVPACRTLDCVSVFTHSVDRAEEVLSIAEGYDAEDPFSRTRVEMEQLELKELRLGSPEAKQLEFFGDKEAESLHQGAVLRLRSLVSHIVEVDYRPFSEAARLLYEGAWVAERYLSVGAHFEKGADDADPVVRSIVLGGRELSAGDAFSGIVRLAALRRKTEAAWENMDVLVLPTTPTNYTLEEVAQDPIGTNSRLGTYTNFVNLLDLCALALPAGFKEDGSALGVTILAPAFCEKRLLDLGRVYLQAFDKGYSETQ